MQIKAMTDSGQKDLSLQDKLDRFEKLLTLIEQNGRANPEEKFYVWRRDLDGKLITLRIRCNIRSVGDIDNVNQQFSAKLWFSACWFEPLLRGKGSREDIDWESFWDPRITFENAISVNVKSKKHYLTYIPEESPDPEVKLSMHLEGTFKEIMELEDFPFDYQELNIVIGTDWGAKDVVFEKDMRIKDSINVFNFTGNQSYNLQPHLISTSKELDKDSSGSHKKYNCHTLTFHVSRRVGYYFWNVLFVTAVIMLLTFCSLAVPPDEPGDRLGVTVTLLLTSVAFKYAVSQGLPTISYLTLLDIYVLSCLVLQSLFLVQNAVAGVVSDGRQFDLYSGMVLAAAVVLFHIIFVLVVGLKIVKRNNILSQYTRSYNRLCADINEDYRRRKKKVEEQQKTNETGKQENQLPNGTVKAENEYHFKANRSTNSSQLVLKPHNTMDQLQDDIKSRDTSDQSLVDIKSRDTPPGLERRSSKPVSTSGAIVEVMSDSEDDGSFSYQPLYPTPPPKPKRSRDKKKYFEALRDYKNPEGNPDVLPFKAGEVLVANMLKVRSDGFVPAENSNGQSGIVPTAYLKPSPRKLPRVESN